MRFRLQVGSKIQCKGHPMNINEFKPTGISRSITRSFLFASLTLASVTFNTGIANAIEFTKPKAVVELFTSQGCSSCPPADAALKQLNENGELLGLALHVDYWDRLGWKDTFASAENTDRQWRYARALGERQVYTPQAIINGRTHLVGSRKVQILDTAYGFSEDAKGLTVDINLQKIGDSVKVMIDQSETSNRATLYAFYFNPSAEVAIKRGENAGKKIAYSNVVGKVETVGMVGDGGFATEFAIADMKQKGYAACALILQTKSSDGGPGAIVGATVISDL